MANYTQVIRKDNKPNLKTLKDDINSRKDKDFFRPTGTQIYVGSQGSGKTISAVHHLLKLKQRYPKSIIVSNLDLKFLSKKSLDDYKTNYGLAEDGETLRFYDKVYEDSYIYFSDMSELSEALVTVNNDKYGVIYLIDEIHTYFNALDSKNIPMFVFTEISQQRKQRKLIIGTSQLFMRAAKPLREQCDNVIVCNTLFGVFTRQVAYDGESLEQDYSGKLSGNKKKTGWFIHTRKTREAFDTMQKVVSGRDEFEQIQKPMTIQAHGHFKKTYTLK